MPGKSSQKNRPKKKKKKKKKGESSRVTQGAKKADASSAQKESPEMKRGKIVGG